MKGPRSSYRAHARKTRHCSAELGEELGLPSKRVGTTKIVIGRREWISLPEFGVGPLNAKIDSGARSSSLHAEEIQVSEDGRQVSFVTRDRQARRVRCDARVGGMAKVKSSSGEASLRVWIETEAVMAGGLRWKLRLTLADRSGMKCPMLLGRRALSGYFLIDTHGAHLTGKLEDLKLEG